MLVHLWEMDWIETSCWLSWEKNERTAWRYVCVYIKFWYTPWWKWYFWRLSVDALCIRLARGVYIGHIWSWDFRSNLLMGSRCVFKNKKEEALFLMLVWLGYLPQPHALWCFSLWASNSVFELKVLPQHSNVSLLDSHIFTISPIIALTISSLRYKSTECLRTEIKKRREFRRVFLG